MKWFRMYSETLNDPKAQQLSGDEFKAWVNLLCLQNQNNSEEFSEKDARFALRMSEKRAGKIIKKLVGYGLLDKTETGLKPHNWAIRQYKSDTSNERVKRFRERAGNAECNVTVTPPDTDTDTDTERTKKRGARGSRLPPDWKPDSGLLAWAAKERPDLVLAKTVSSFTDYWAGISGQRGVKLDWDATFRNWVRREKQNATGGNNHNPGEAERRRIIAETLGLAGGEEGGYDDGIVVDGDGMVCKHPAIGQGAGKGVNSGAGGDASTGNTRRSSGGDGQITSFRRGIG